MFFRRVLTNKYKFNNIEAVVLFFCFVFALTDGKNVDEINCDAVNGVFGNKRIALYKYSNPRKTFSSSKRAGRIYVFVNNRLAYANGGVIGRDDCGACENQKCRARQKDSDWQ